MHLTFEEFVAARAAALLRLAVMLCGDAHHAEDLVQSALAKAYRRWDRVLEADSPEAYVRQIVVREHLSWWRRASSREIPSPHPHQLASPDPAISSDPASQHADFDASWALLARLPPRQRAVLVLRYYQDLSDDQIAGILECSVGTVRSNASRGLNKLRQVTPGVERELLP